jgi:pSer/pThr/pTyr-binding forkhead associated (FHA) protein
MFKLVIQDDEGKTTVVPLIRDEITIGRKEGNTIRLTERNVSRRHARILRNNGEVHIEDLGSYNGIRVNNARIAERVNLRVSDQVQIGDYKLYLKAEGVEQVDDARTMPIERVDSQTATDVIPAVSPSAAPTQPLGIPQTPIAASGLAAGQSLVGNPNRTLVAIADTDPAGRPVATAAAVAALTATAGYGKLVVLSSNFAGKEFELSRPQMIIGRTDENDIVINHRSISRNHAKLVREPDTGRYTISDLQSSNGVRVNGQDYGKVELRRGDVVDLGHVRLRFVEPGEDFVFARDAVITDVPDAGGKKGLLVAIVLGVLLLGGIGVFFAMKGGGKEETVKAGSGSGTNSINDNGSNGSDTVVAINPEGSNGSDSVVVENGSNAVQNTVEIDAGVAVSPNNSADDVKIECLKLAADKKWPDLVTCTDRLATADPATSKSLRAKAVMENKADTAQRKVTDALKDKKYATAKTELDKIPADSVYRSDAKAAYDSAVSGAATDVAEQARALAADHKCGEFERLVAKANRDGTDGKLGNTRCKPDTVAVKNPNPNTSTNPNPNSGSNTVQTPPPATCDADALRDKGQDHLQTGMDAAALAAFEASMKCRPDAGLLRLAFMAACRSKNAAKARYYHPKLPAATTTGIVQICVRNGITLP